MGRVQRCYDACTIPKEEKKVMMMMMMIVELMCTFISLIHSFCMRCIHMHAFLFA